MAWSYSRKKPYKSDAARPLRFDPKAVAGWRVQVGPRSLTATKRPQGSKVRRPSEGTHLWIPHMNLQHYNGESPGPSSTTHHQITDHLYCTESLALLSKLHWLRTPPGFWGTAPGPSTDPKARRSTGPSRWRRPPRPGRHRPPRRCRTGGAAFWSVRCRILVGLPKEPEMEATWQNARRPAGKRSASARWLASSWALRSIPHRSRILRSKCATVASVILPLQRCISLSTSRLPSPSPSTD